MHEAFFKHPVTVKLPTGSTHALCSASEAALFMQERWPEEQTSKYRDALQACTGPLSTASDIENTRRAFSAAVKQAGLNVRGLPRYDEEAPAPRSVEQPKSSYITDDKRRDRGHREEQEDFLARFLARETGIIEAQARQLIDIVGNDRASLLREARILKAQP